MYFCLLHKLEVILGCLIVKDDIHIMVDKVMVKSLAVNIFWSLECKNRRNLFSVDLKYMIYSVTFVMWNVYWRKVKITSKKFGNILILEINQN